MPIDKAAAEIRQLAAADTDIKLVETSSQPYAIVKGIEAKSPPWDRTTYDIAIVIPIAYDLGTPLDGFYIALPYKFNGGEHNRVNGQSLAMENRDWKLVSWHYVDGKQFRLGIDCIESHIVHCRGFFLERGATNART